MLERDEIVIRDPFVFRENTKYYLLGTTGTDCWNKGSDLTLYVSSDLHFFENCGALIEGKTLQGYTQIWAPEIHKYQNKYYMIVSVFQEKKGRGCLILEANSIKGPFTLLTGEYITPQDWWCLDATLFCKDGKPYLFFSNEGIHPITNDGDGSLFVAELSLDLKQMVGRPKKIISGKYSDFTEEIEVHGVRMYVAEGPFVLTENDEIALYWSTFTKQGYSVVRSVSKDVFGEYKFDKFIFKEDGGHAMVFSDFQGNKHITFHQPNNSPYERIKIFPMGK